MSNGPQSPLTLPTGKQSDSLGNILEGPAARQSIEQDIGNLHQSIIDINNLFDKVEGPLQRFDPSGALAVEWKDFKKRFNQHVDKSRVNATAAYRIMKAYSSAVLGKIGETLCSITVEDLVAEIGTFEEKVQAHTLVAEDVRDSFRLIVANIDQFKEKVKTTFDASRFGGTIPADIAAAFNDIDALQAKVDSVPVELTDQESGFLAMVAPLVPRAAKVLCLITPSATFQAVQSLFATSDSEKAQEELVQKTALQDIENVAQRIDAIAHIWHYLYTDLLSLKTDLSLCSGERNIKNPAFLLPKINNSRSVFDCLTKCLEMYVYQFPQRAALTTSSAA